MTAVPAMVSGAKPVFGHLAEFRRTPEELFHRGYREHGSVFSFSLAGRRAVVLLGSAHNRFFYAQTDGLLSIRAAYPFFSRMFAPEFYFFADPEEYQRQRSIVLPRFQGRQLEGYVTSMQRETAALIDELGDSGRFDMAALLGPLVLRIAARCFLGADIAVVLDRDFYTEFRRFAGGMGFFPPPWVPSPRNLRSRAARDRLRAAFRTLIERRRSHPIDPPDFLQTLAGAHYPDGTPVPDSVRVNLVLMLTWAGHETTTGHLAWALADLLDHPEDLRRVRAEIPPGPLDLAAVKHLEHLDNCLLETERLHPVAYVQARRATGDFDLDGHTVPAGTLVFTSPAVSHRLAEEHPRPDDYWPDRFAMGRDGRLARQALIGFGGGPHRCTGVHFAYQEMKVVLAMLLSRYEFTLVDGTPRPARGFVTKWPASPCRVDYRRIG
ncbi:cytochrome P450 [Saccharothrix violaceirubra]|uniref:Sterol 14-demethylase n=1 Tax=Saccharothrix violaceirubra TaxID=413306 RepID=A0A7W7WVH8_9PSEU|nr:cytochrome P450 [Saccharothrix violaceirubra]MBB4964922.1 sterol 14-demethylase [Saccharothrix violaceirubra]